MCNLYSITKGQQAIIEFTRAMRDKTGNLPPLPGIFPDMAAPVARNAPDGVRELAMLRWGMPTPPKFVRGSVDTGVTNIRNVKSPHWRRWLKPESRCVVPATSFSEYEPKPDPVTKRKAPVWFALSEERPLFCFAGIWTPWSGTRKNAEGDMDHELFGFLTTEANADVRPIHARAMPVILTTEDEIETWMTAPNEEAIELQRPLSDEMLRIVARGEKEDGVAK
jgi:putative SOS response-associated peptidase YedK